MATFAGKHSFDESWLRAAEDGSLPRVASEDPRFSAILALPDFERFVYVLSVLEGCTDQECASVLGVSAQQVEETRLRALQHFWKRT
jgi:DNA-directed RNA polymerase specialized sigma24 family protein